MATWNRLRMTRRLVVLASGSGSNLQALIDAAGLDLDVRVVAVVSDQPSAYALTRAAAAGIPAIALPRRTDEARRDYDCRLAAAVGEYEPDLVVLAGWMRLLTMEFLGVFPGAVINLHPALPGDLPGIDSVARAYDESRSGTRSYTGVMVHFVPDEGVDDGPVIATATVDIAPDDTLDSLTQRAHAAEHRLLVDAIRTLPEPVTAHR